MKWWHVLNWPWNRLSADLQRRHTIGIMAISGAAIIMILFLWIWEWLGG